jgi:hypothetical protein
LKIFPFKIIIKDVFRIFLYYINDFIRYFIRFVQTKSLSELVEPFGEVVIEYGLEDSNHGVREEGQWNVGPVNDWVHWFTHNPGADGIEYEIHHSHNELLWPVLLAQFHIGQSNGCH